jgi:4-hydroxybenzoate polyprenyltransferase
MAAVPLGPIGLAVVLVSLLLSYGYSVGPIRFSRRMLLAPVILTAAYVAVPYALGVTVAGGRLGGRDAPFVAGLLVLFFARIILKDFRDRLGDEAFGKPTLLFRLGASATCAISIGGAVAGTAVLLVAVAPSFPVMLVLAAELAGVVWMLLRLRGSSDPRLEQVAIGTAARAGNALVIAILAWLVLTAGGAPTLSIDLFEIGLGALFAVSFLSLALHPERVRIGYKA